MDPPEAPGCAGMSRRAVRAIIIRGEQLLVMHRNKFGKEYDTLPGGGVDYGEDLEQALLRELAEETQVVIGDHRLVFTEDSGGMYGSQFIYLCEYVSGEPELAANSEEAQINKLGKNLYYPMWVNISDLPDLPFVSERLKSAIIEALQTAFPHEPVQIS